MGTVQETANRAELEALKEALMKTFETPRLASGQVFSEISVQFNASTKPEIQAFFDEKLKDLEEYEIDLLLSPQFTPKEEELKEYGRAFGLSSFSKESLESLAQEVADKQLKTPIKLEAGETVHCPVFDILVERFVNSLRLHYEVNETLESAIREFAPDDKQGLLGLHVRDGLFKFPQYCDVFRAILQTMSQQNSFAEEDLIFFVDSLRTYKPQSVEDFAGMMDRLIKSCMDDMANAEERSYHNEEIKAGSMGSVSDLHEAEAVRETYAKIIERAKVLKATCEAAKG